MNVTFSSYCNIVKHEHAAFFLIFAYIFILKKIYFHILVGKMKLLLYNCFCYAKL